MVGSLGHSDQMLRLTTFLLLLLDTPEYRETGKILLTQQEVASFINVSRAQLAKMYGQLRKEGIIDTGNRFVTVLDEKSCKPIKSCKRAVPFIRSWGKNNTEGAPSPERPFCVIFLSVVL